MEQPFRRMWNDLYRNPQLRHTMCSVVANQALTLLLWVGVYRMEVNAEFSKVYYLDTDHEMSTGNVFFDGLLNGVFTIACLGIISFVMLGFVLYDFQRVVKCWLTISCLLILFGVSGQTFYDVSQRVFGQDTENGRYLTLVVTCLSTLVYGISGIVAFLANGSQSLHQFYVITNCSLVSVFYLRAFPNYTTWFVLAIVVFWDIFAVMAPMGPLRKVQDKAADYSNNILKFVMFSADNKREVSGADIIESKEVVNEEREMRKGVRELIERYTQKEAQDEELVQKIRQRRVAWNPDSDSTEQSPLVEEKPEEKVIPSYIWPYEPKPGDGEEDDGGYDKSSWASSITTFSDVSEKEVKDDLEEDLANVVDIGNDENLVDEEDDEESEDDLENLEDEEDDDEESEEGLVSDDDADIDDLIANDLKNADDLDVSTAEEGDPESWLPWYEEQLKEHQPTERTAADALNDGDVVRLGFGDFVFYSMLIGQTATGGCAIAVIAAMFGILVGLLVTLSILSSEESTTPALPAPIVIASFFYFSTKFLWENVMFGG